MPSTLFYIVAVQRRNGFPRLGKAMKNLVYEIRAEAEEAAREYEKTFGVRFGVYTLVAEEYYHTECEDGFTPIVLSQRIDGINA